MLHVIRVPAAAAGRWLRSIKPERRYLLAGLPGAISSVPDGMAAAVPVGVNPVQGLYAAGVAEAAPNSDGTPSYTNRDIIAQGAANLAVTMFAATLFLPAAAAAGIGVALSVLLQLNTEAMDLKVVELVPREDGRFEERRAPSALTGDHVTILDVYGSLLHAGSRTLQAHLPDPAGTQAPAVVLRLRGRISLGATFIKVAGDYADGLGAVGGRLYLSGLQPSLTERLHRTGSVEGPVRAFEATSGGGESTQAAYAGAWLIRRHEKETPVG